MPPTPDRLRDRQSKMSVMLTTRFGRLSLIVALAVWFGLVGTMSSACGPGGGPDPASGPVDAGDASGVGGNLPEEPPEQKSVGEGSEMEGSTAGALNCPRVGDSLYLVFGHDITFDAMGMASISHVVAAQALELRATEAYVTESGAQAVIVESNLAGPRAELNVYVSGAAGTCTVEASALLVPVVAGRCEDGIVWLTISEQWRDYSLTMI